MLFIVGGRFREVHFQTPKIFDDEWDKIVQLSGLPPDSRSARSELQDYVGLYRELRFDAQRDMVVPCGRKCLRRGTRNRSP